MQAANGEVGPAVARVLMPLTLQPRPQLTWRRQGAHLTGWAPGGGGSPGGWAPSRGITWQLGTWPGGELTWQVGLRCGIGLFLAHVRQCHTAVTVLPAAGGLGADHSTVLLAGVVRLICGPGKTSSHQGLEASPRTPLLPSAPWAAQPPSARFHCFLTWAHRAPVLPKYQPPIPWISL